MKFPDDVRFPALTRAGLTVFFVAGLSACATAGGGAGDSGLASVEAPAQAANGPAADYPIVVGTPYYVGDVEYVPNDTLNYDHVGYGAVDQGAMGYSGAHHTLPLPSYVEVTSLETGRTVLVRLERRGPMVSNHLLALSPAAMAQLGADEETPVRVRRVNPPEAERFALRGGNAAPLRMDTPQSLLTVLQRRLPAHGAASLRAANSAAPQPVDEVIETVELAASEAEPAALPVADAIPELPPVAEAVPAASPVVANASPPPLPPIEATANAPEAAADETFAEAFHTTTEPAAAPDTTPAAEGDFVVQAAAFSTMERAQRVANVIGGRVTQAGRFYRVRTGPFTTRGEAEASLANVRRAGYSDARIYTSG